MSNDTKQFCTFNLADLFLGVEVSRVQEVLRYQDMTEVPLTSSVVGGLINLRGQIVTAINLRQRFGFSSDGPDGVEHPMNVVVRADDGVASLLVDSIGDVLEIPEDAFEPPPPTVAKGADLICGVYKLEGRLLLVLDIKKALCFESNAS